MFFCVLHSESPDDYLMSGYPYILHKNVIPLDVDLDCATRGRVHLRGYGECQVSFTPIASDLDRGLVLPYS